LLLKVFACRHPEESEMEGEEINSEFGEGIWWASSFIKLFVVTKRQHFSPS
jgi:hypothetical protein